MQGGAYVLSHRAAKAVASCALGPIRDCPNKFLQDVRNAKESARMRSSCVVHQTAGHDDLFTGVCLHQASLQLRTGFESSEHECMLTLFGGANARGALDAQDSTDGAAAWHKARMVVKRKCRCPITAHPFKHQSLLLRMRNFSEGLGCARLDA